MSDETTFTAADGPRLRRGGVPMVKQPSTVWMSQQFEEFAVMTNEGVMRGHALDWVAYDPISGHVWPVSGEYVRQHYRRISGEEAADGA